MNCLFFTDFHFNSSQSQQVLAASTLIKFIKDSEELNKEQVDLVFLGGDIAYSGAAEEYSLFEETFLDPLKSIPSLKAAVVYAVPGNHDVNCGLGVPISWDGIRKRNQQVFFCEGNHGQSARRQRSEVFQEYENFVNRNGIISPKPSKQVSLHDKPPNLPFEALLINTSFFSDYDEDSSLPTTPCPIDSIRGLTKDRKNEKPLLILGHHSTDTFIKEHQRHLNSYLQDNNAFYLHGHKHDPEISFKPSGIIKSIGFGATYQAPLAHETKGPYKNTFAYFKFNSNLSIKGFTWDSTSGRWIETTKTTFHDAFTKTNYSDGFIDLNFSEHSPNQEKSPPKAAIDILPTHSKHPFSIISTGIPSSALWNNFVRLSENYKSAADPSTELTTPQVEKDGKYEFFIESRDNRYLAICIPAPSHILSSKEVESYNTRLDTEDNKSITVVSFGKISSEARNLYLRLKTKKKLEILTQSELTGKCEELLSIHQKEYLANYDQATYKFSILADESEIYALIEKPAPSKSFLVINKSASLVLPSDPLLVRLRQYVPRFNKLLYEGDLNHQTELSNLIDFSEKDYLSDCYKEYNVMKYAALANIGLRFTDYTLENVYINANASESSHQDSNRLEDMLEDHLASYPVSDNIKRHLRSQLLNTKQETENQETSLAREYCQKYGAVLIEVDPFCETGVS